jgi:hypothetical protein
MELVPVLLVRPVAGFVDRDRLLLRLGAMLFLLLVEMVLMMIFECKEGEREGGREGKEYSLLLVERKEDGRKIEFR